MIHIRLASEDDHQRWNDYVRERADASPYHLMEWSLACETAYKHGRLYLIAERQGAIIGVLPLCRIGLPFTKGYLCSLPFCDIGGCLSENQEIRQKLIDAALQIADQWKISSVQIRSRILETSDSDLEYSGKVSMLLPLPESSDVLLASFKSKLRSQIRKAEKNGLTFHSGRTTDDLIRFYQVLSSNMRDLGSPVHSFQWFESIQTLYADEMIVGVVSKGDIPVGAGILLFRGRNVVIPWASTLTEYNHLAPNMLLYWNLLRYATDKQCQVFDFGRSSYGAGTFRFKKQWGAKPARLTWLNYSVDGSFTEAPGGSKIPRKLVASIWRRLPLPVANTLGPRIRKFISL